MAHMLLLLEEIDLNDVMDDGPHYAVDICYGTITTTVVSYCTGHY